MKKAKIYNPSKTAMQSGTAKTKYWILEFNKENFETDYLMGWNASRDTQKIKIVIKDLLIVSIALLSTLT